MKKPSFKISCAAALVCATFEVSAEMLVGELAGEFAVNNLGAVNYTIPLNVSPGTAGMEPKLAVSYSSRGGNGLLGLGFSLAGLSTITRGGASLDQDGFIDGVDFDDNDRFLLDGQRLELISTNGLAYGDAGSEYRTEIDSFSRVIAHDRAGNGPAWFKVWTQSGLIYEYGNTVDSSFEPGSHSNVLSWAVNKISDTTGNYMTFTYEETSAGPHISRIDYTGNTNTGLIPYNSVEFVYEGRPDASLHFFMGTRMEQTNRLSKIVMKHDGNYMHDYRFTYMTSEAGQSILESFQQFFGENAGADCLPETRFEYSGHSAGTNFIYLFGTSILPSGLGFDSWEANVNDWESQWQQWQNDMEDWQDDWDTWVAEGESLQAEIDDWESQRDDYYQQGEGEHWESVWNNLQDAWQEWEQQGDQLESELRGLENDWHDREGGWKDLVLTADFNGDGLSDICGMSSYSARRWLGLSDGDGRFTFTSGTDLLPAGLGFDSWEGCGWSRDNGGYWSTDPMDQLLTADFNGDGMADVCCMGLNNRWLGLSNGDGTFSFTSGMNLLPAGLGFGNVAQGYSSQLLAADFNGDGLADICAMGSLNSHRWLGLSNGDGTFSFTSGMNLLPAGLGFSSTTYDQADRLLAGDFNGDGWADICGMGSSGSHRWLGLSNGDGTFSFTSGTDLLSAGLGFGSTTYNKADRLLIADFNGDGWADICSMGSAGSHRWVGLSKGNGTFMFTSGTDLLPTGLGFSSTTYDKADEILTADFNGDGLADICAMGSSGSHRWLGLSNGDGTFSFTAGTDLLPAELEFSSTTYNEADRLLAGDFNGDGWVDICGMGSSGSHRWLGLSNGDGTFSFTSGSNLLPAGLEFSSTTYDQADRLLVGDFNGDGVSDIGSMGDTSPHRWIGLNGNKAMRIKKITQGYQNETEHGVVTQVEYRPLTDTNIYIKGSGAEFPIHDIVSPTYVVSTLTKDNGQEGTYCTDYTYRAARYHAHGRGFLGFQQFESYDRQTKLSHIETLAHDFPFTGRPLKTETFYIPDPAADPDAPGYSQLIARVKNDWVFDLVNGGTLFAFSPKSVETHWELGHTGTPWSVTTSYRWYDNQPVNTLPPAVQPTNLYAEITHGNPVKTVIDHGSGLITTTRNSYDDRVDATHWLLGRLDTSSVTHEAPELDPVVRTSAFDYDPVTGLLAQEILEPGNAQFERITDYYHDTFGNVTNKTLTPAGLPPRTVLADTYDARGRFVEQRRNARGHPTLFVNDQARGVPRFSTDPNNLTTEWRYDKTGRRIYEQRPDNTTTIHDYFWDYATTVAVPTAPGSTSTIVQTAAYKTLTQSDGASPVTVWHDKQGREIRRQTLSADGRTVNIDYGYNAIAQPIAVSEPWLETGGTPVYTFTEYDELGRMQYVTAPDGTITETVYNGREQSVIKDSNHRTTGTGTPRHQITTSLKDTRGRLLSVTNALNETMTYLHDPVGRLIQTTDPENNVIEIHYDLRGNKIRQNDPDMGEWSYTYNTLDQLESQTDANGNVIWTAYDLLGRTVARTNSIMTSEGLKRESTAAWYYDATGDGGKIGALRREEHRDGLSRFVNRKTYAYDALGRPLFELRNYDSKWYYTTLQYDEYSRVLSSGYYWRPAGMEGSSHQLSPVWNSLTTTNTYNPYGALLEVRDDTGHTWWQCSASDYDEQGRLVRFEYGNGLATTNHFNSLTGRMEGTGILDGVLGVAEYGFGHDHLGNLTQRSLNRDMTMLTESCTYDALNRLETSTVGGTTSESSYDALGNIKTRSGISGTYQYGGPRPHAVTSADHCNYYYDNNGNIVRRDRNSQYEFTANWNSFNKPISIFSGLDGSEFEYDVNGKRTQQLIFEGGEVRKKIYVAETYEMEERLINTNETDRTLWQWEPLHSRIYVNTPTGKIGIHEQAALTNGVGPITRSYIHKDHLGSIVAVSDSSTNITDYSYDAWGHQRDASDWSLLSDPITNNSGRITDRGYTGHEMLGHLDLVHMNGRIYDPVIGRMISPDPLIQSPDNLQSFNRYSYVFNNPLTHTDPSGFSTRSARATRDAKREAYRHYLRNEEPITSAALSVQDQINAIAAGQDIDMDRYDWLTWVNETGRPDSGYYELNFFPTIAATTMFSQEDLTNNDLKDQTTYGIGTGSQIAVEQAASGENGKFTNGATTQSQAETQATEYRNAEFNQYSRWDSFRYKVGYQNYRIKELGRWIGSFGFDYPDYSQDGFFDQTQREIAAFEESGFRVAGTVPGIGRSRAGQAVIKAGEKIGIYGQRIGGGGKLQPVSLITNRYVSKSKTIGSKTFRAVSSGYGRFTTGFGQGMAESQGAVGANPNLGRSGNLGYVLGNFVGSLIQ